METVQTGIDRIREDRWKSLKGLRLGLLANQASLDQQLNHSRDVINRLLPGGLKALFGPQHGFGGEDQDNMVETPHGMDTELGIPVFSLYSDAREPDPSMFEKIDILVIDLQDVGTRVYTFASTMLNCMRSAAKEGKKILILDRPNPLGGEIIEGNLLEEDLFSFVGPCRFPMRHGLTMGEMAVIFKQVHSIECELEVIPMKGWNRSMIWPQTGLRWLMPSTNMPTQETAAVYPGQVIWEGTNISEGRGTCRPFEIFGAPYVDTGAVRESIDPDELEGCRLQEYTFRPTFHKWKGHLCRGFMIHITDASRYRPFYCSTAIMLAILQAHRDSFRWREPPYEYEYEKKPIELIMGSRSLAKRIEKGIPFSILKKDFLADSEFFSNWRKPYLIY